ncbi:MAG: RraA family protein [Epsilonproteobacteria bacterium]|nr:RraA family protein [Campylobacterota bacterium]
MKSKIIKYIEKNKISSVEISDALVKQGVLDGLKPINQRHFAVGEVEYIYTFSNSNWELHKQISDIHEDKIVFIDTFDCSNRAVLGDIVSKYIMLYKNAKAIIVNGLVRDVHRLKKEDYSMWSKGVTPLGCYNKEMTLDKNIENEIKKRKEMFQNSIIVADDSGCTLIEEKNINEQFLNKLEFIELQEDIWYFCIDTLKMNTYKTICLKKYLDDKNEILPPNLIKRLEKFENEFKELKK